MYSVITEIKPNNAGQVENDKAKTLIEIAELKKKTLIQTAE